MKEFLDSYLLGDLAKALNADLSEVLDWSRFPCRPVAARSAGGNTALGRFKGAIGLPECQEFGNALAELARDGPQKVILDLAETSLSESALGVLLGFAALRHGGNKRLYLYRPSAQIRSLLKDVKLTAFFSYLESENDLIVTMVV